MNNPYTILTGMKLPDDCISHIMSFNRPCHPVVTEMNENFLRCGVCKCPVKSYAGEISLCYYTLQLCCVPCGINGHIVCKDCPTDDSCDCSDDSWFSWFSF